MPSDTDFESDYVTGLEDIPNEKVEVKKPQLRKRPFKGLNDPRQTSSFIQNILSEDSKTGIAVVDLFVAVKEVKDNLDCLVRKNDDVFQQINVLNVESEVVREEYRNLAEDMQSFLNELKGETINAKLSRNRKCNSEKPEATQNKVDCHPTEDSRPASLKNAFGCVDCSDTILKNSIKNRPRISKTLLGSFLASVLWLKKRETSLAKSFPPKSETKVKGSDSTVRIICDVCEMLGGFADSTSEDDECWSETKEESSHSPMTSCKASTSVESNDSDSVFEETFETPPPSPPTTPTSEFPELKPKPSDTRMSDSTRKDKKRSIGTGTDGATSSVTGVLAEKIKSAAEHLKFKTKAVMTDQEDKMPAEKLKKLPELTIAGDTTPGAFDIMVRKAEEFRSYSSDSLDSVHDFDSDELRSSLSAEEEMEDFAGANLSTSSPDPKAIFPRSRPGDAPITETYKTAKPAFFEVWKRYPAVFMQEMVLRTAKIKQGESWEVKEYKSAAANEIVALAPGEKREKEVVIENSNLDVVIYIQVEVENDDKKEQLMVDFTTNSLGTQTSIPDNESRPQEEDEQQKSYHNILTNEMENAEESIATAADETAESPEKVEIEKLVDADEEVPEIFISKSTSNTSKETEQAVAVEMIMKEGVLTTNTYDEQVEVHWMYVIDCPQPFYRPARNVELEKALELIHEIENSVVDTKLSDAISILPRLESELRKHFKHKVKHLEDSEFDKSMDTFFSAFDIWSVEVTNDEESEGSEERLYNLLTLLGDLEKAVKADEHSTTVELCAYSSSKIYGLLHALTESIRELEECSNVTCLSQTLDIASQVDTAVREYESIVKRTPTDYVASPPRRSRKRLKNHPSGEASPKAHLKNVRKKVFEMVEEEAVHTEARLERDSDKLDRLERENEEAMKFVEAFLQKTQRRASELVTLKTDLKELSAALDELYEKMSKVKDSKNKRTRPKEESDDESGLASFPRSGTRPGMAEPIKETVSGLLFALDNLKSRARQKNELCREILSDVSSEKEIKDHDGLPRSSRSSFTAKNVEDLQAWVRDFKKIGDHSLYLSWTKPEGPLADSVVGYEIFVNGKLNQKVRNPQRVQAVLYSVDLNTTAEVLLYGLLENGFKIFLSTVTYATS